MENFLPKSGQDSLDGLRKTIFAYIADIFQFKPGILREAASDGRSYALTSKKVFKKYKA